MDFYEMNRKQLQSLCKQHGIPANLRNTEMAVRLTLLLKEDEILNEPVCKNLEEIEGEIDSEVETKKAKKVKFSPENQTFYFVSTDNDSNSDCDYNPKKKQGRKRKSMVAKQVQVFENSRGLEHSHKIIDSPGRVTRSVAQKMDEGNAEAVFSPLPGKKKVTNRVKKVDSCDKPPPEVELIERVDSNAEHAKLNGGLIQRQLRSRVVVSDDGGNSLVLRKNLVPRGSKKPKQNKGSDGDLLPIETYEENVPVGKGIKPDSPSRVTRSRAQKMDEGNAEAVFPPLPGKKKVTNRVKKVDSCDKPPPEVELIERVDSKAEHANLNGGLIQRQLRSRVVVSDDGGNSLVLMKSLVSRGSKKPKQNKGSDGDLLPTETYEENVPVGKGIKSDSPGRVTRSRAQKMDKGNAEAVFSPLPGKKKVTNRVKKVDSCDKPPPEVELIERVDSNAELANLNGGSRVVVSDDGGNSLVLRKNLVPMGSKKSKQNKGSGGDLLPTETYEENVPVGKGIKPEKVQKQCKGNITKVEGSSVLSEKSGKTDLGGSRITRSRTQVEGNSSGVESKTDILKVQEKGQEVLQLEESCKGLDRKHLRRKSAVPLKRSLEGDNLANEAVVPGKTLRSSKRNLAGDGDSACWPLAETKLFGRSKKPKTKFVGKASGQEECELEEPSKGPSMNTSGQKIPLFQKGKELAKGDTRKRSGNIDLERASKVESSVERIEENVAVLPNGPLRRSRRKTTLFSSADHDDREFRICEAAGTVKQSTAAGTVKQSTESVPDKGGNVSKSLRRSSRNACENILTEATGDMCGIANGVKKDGLVKQIQVPTFEKESSLIVHDSLNKSPQRRSSRIVSKSGLVSPTGRTGIAAGKNKKSESRMPIIKEKVSFAKINSPLEEIPSIDIGLNLLDASGNENNTDSCFSKGLERSSKQRKGSSKNGESAGRGQPVYDEVSTAYSVMEKAMDISGHLKDNQFSESMKFQGISTVQKPQNVTETLINEMENSVPDNTTASDMDYHSCLSLNRGLTGHAIAVEQNPLECPDKFSNVVSSTFPCLSDGHSPTYQPDCEGECSNLLDLKKGLETDESLTVKTSNQRIDVVDDQLEGGSKVSVPEDQNLVQLDASGFEQPVLVEPVLEDHLTELGEKKESDRNNAKSSELVEEICALSSCDREEMVQVDVGSTAETSAETDGDIHLGRIVHSDTAVTPSKFSLVKEDGNQLEAQSKIVGESSINHIGKKDSCSYVTEVPDETTSSWKGAILCGHERTKGVMPEENESFEALHMGHKPSVNEEFVNEGFERNSKMDDGILSKRDGQVAEDKRQEVSDESFDNISEETKGKYAHDLPDCGRTSSITLQESATDKFGSGSGTVVFNSTDSCCSKEAVEKSSKKGESAAMGQPVYFDVSAAHSSIEKTMDISAHLKENQLSKYNNLQDIGLNVLENATGRDMDDNNNPSLDRGDTGHIIAVEQTSEECLDKLSNVGFSRLTCLGDGHSPTWQPGCEGECTNLLDLKGLETDESLTVKTSYQRSDVAHDQLEDDSKASVPEDQDLVQLDARGNNQPVLVEPVIEGHLTELVENNESDRNTAKSSAVVEETSEETVGDIHLDRIVPSDTAVTPSKSSLVKQVSSQEVRITSTCEVPDIMSNEGDQLENQFKSQVEGRSICEIDEALLYGSKNQNLSFDEVDYLEDDTVAASKIESSMGAIVVETESISLSDCALAKMQHGNENILKEVSSEMKRHPPIASDDSVHMDGNADMDDNVGTLDGGMNSLNVSSKTEISSNNIGNFLVGDELADPSCCDRGIILGNAGVSNSMAQSIPGLADTDGIVGTESITQVKLCADNSCAKPQMYSGDLSGLNNAEEKEMTYEDREGDQLKYQFKSPVEGRNIHERNEALLHGSENQNLSFEEVNILEKHTVAANNTESSMDAVVDETESQSRSDFSLAKMRHGNENKSPGPSNMVVLVDSEVQERTLNNVTQSVLLLDQVKYGDPDIHKEVSLEMKKRHPSIASVDSMHTDGNADMDDNIGRLDGGINSVNVSLKTEINSDNTGDFLVRDELGDLYCCDHGIILGNAGVSNRVSQNEPGLADTDTIVDTESITQVNLSADNFCAKRQMHSGDLSGLNESEGRNNAEEKEMTYEDRGTVSLLEGDQLKDQFKSPVEGGIIRERDEALLHGSQNQNLSFDEVDILEKHTVAANDIGSSMDALVDETQSGSFSDFALAKIRPGNENKSPGPSNMVVPVDSEVQERASNEEHQMKCGDLELQGNEFGVPERVSGMKVVESLTGINRTRTSQETEEVIDLLNLNDRDIISGDSKKSPGFENLHPISMVKPEMGVDCCADSPATNSSHGQCLLHQGEEATAETKALELNAASPLFAVGIAQVAAGKLTDHEHKSEEVMELKSTLEMGIHYPVGSPVTNFSSYGDSKRDEFQKLDAGVVKANLMNEVGEHVKDGIENDLGIAQVVAEQHSDHGQRMADELISNHPPVSDGNTCINEGPKEKGIRPINQVFVAHEDIDESGDIEYSNVWASTGKSVDDSEMSGSSPGAFHVPIDVPAANSDPNYLMQARSNVNLDVEDTKFSVESEIVSEQNVTADQCPISANSVLRKDNLESPRVRSWEADSDKSISVSSAPRENKTESGP